MVKLEKMENVMKHQQHQPKAAQPSVQQGADFKSTGVKSGLGDDLKHAGVMVGVMITRAMKRSAASGVKSGQGDAEFKIEDTVERGYLKPAAAGGSTQSTHFVAPQQPERVHSSGSKALPEPSPLAVVTATQKIQTEYEHAMKLVTAMQKIKKEHDEIQKQLTSPWRQDKKSLQEKDQKLEQSMGKLEKMENEMKQQHQPPTQQGASVKSADATSMLGDELEHPSVMVGAIMTGAMKTKKEKAKTAKKSVSVVPAREANSSAEDIVTEVANLRSDAKVMRARILSLEEEEKAREDKEAA